MSSASPDQIARLLGLVFAGADLLLEIDDKGAITFALGAAEAITGHKDAALIGKSWTRLVGEPDGEVLAALMHGVAAGERRGPLRLSIAPDRASSRRRQVSISAFRMPGRANALSVAVSLASTMPEFQRTEEGLLPAASFEAATTSLLAQAAKAGDEVRLDLVEMPGLRARTDRLTPKASAEMRRKVAATLRADSYAGLGASEVAPDRFALIRPAKGSSDRLTQQLKEAAGGGLTPVMAALPLHGKGGLDARAIRFALDRFIEEGAQAAQGGFKDAVERTVRDTDKFKILLRDESFRLLYQPVVNLSDERVHHFEALARFEADVSPADMIRLAEELELILDFDIAVVRMVARKLADRGPQTSIAANLSAISLTNPRFTEALLAISDDRAFRKRLMLEVTETQRLVDLQGAARSIEALREAGFLVCLDDFGAGAASLDYLRALTVDFVKIDGRFIRELSEEGREAVLLKHLVNLCEELGIRTVAEVVETRATAQIAKRLGVTLGQGWVFGKPGAEPVYSDPQPVALSRRKGVVQEWG